MSAIKACEPQNLTATALAEGDHARLFVAQLAEESPDLFQVHLLMACEPLLHKYLYTYIYMHVCMYMYIHMYVCKTGRHPLKILLLANRQAKGFALDKK